MKLISDEYRRLNRELHAAADGFGAGGGFHAKNMEGVLRKLGVGDLLDYGCGKGTLKVALAQILPDLLVLEYDPAIQGKDTRPAAADAVACTDVLEHIEPEFLDNVLADINTLAKRIIYLEVATRPANRLLPDGRNTHLIVQPKEWWLTQIAKHFDPIKIISSQGAFIGMFLPRH